MQEEGKIRAICVSNLSIDQLKEGDNTANNTALQAGYNMLDRIVEQDVLPYCAQHDISFIPYFPLASGILSGKYSTDSIFAAGDPRQKRFKGEEAEKKFAIASSLKKFAESKQTTPRI